MSFANCDAAQFWSEVAPLWVEWEDQVELVVGEPGRLGMDSLNLQPNHRVVDLGCGTGQTTVEAANQVTPGRTVGIDISVPMLTRARQRAAAGGLENVEFVHGDVQVHHFDNQSFDRAFSRFGVMFFSDPPAAFANVRQALTSGGMLSFVCWQPESTNEWMLVPRLAAHSALGTAPEPPVPGQPGPFSLADPDRTQAILTAAGFTRVEVVPHNDLMAIPEDRVDGWVASRSSVGGVAELLKTADAESREGAVEAIEAALRARIHQGELRLTRGFWVIAAEV